MANLLWIVLPVEAFWRDHAETQPPRAALTSICIRLSIRGQAEGADPPKERPP